MEFWTRSLGKKIYDLDYEQPTLNQENETRQLIEHLGLSWDDKCLSPQNNKRNVAIASNLQVGKKSTKAALKNGSHISHFSGDLLILIKQLSPNSP